MISSSIGPTFSEDFKIVGVAEEEDILVTLENMESLPTDRSI